MASADSPALLQPCSTAAAAQQTSTPTHGARRQQVGRHGLRVVPAAAPARGEERRPEMLHLPTQRRSVGLPSWRRLRRLIPQAGRQQGDEAGAAGQRGGRRGALAGGDGRRRGRPHDAPLRLLDLWVALAVARPVPLLAADVAAAGAGGLREAVSGAPGAGSGRGGREWRRGGTRWVRAASTAGASCQHPQQPPLHTAQSVVWLLTALGSTDPLAALGALHPLLLRRRPRRRCRRRLPPPLLPPVHPNPLPPGTPLPRPTLLPQRAPRPRRRLLPPPAAGRAERPHQAAGALERANRRRRAAPARRSAGTPAAPGAAAAARGRGCQSAR